MESLRDRITFLRNALDRTVPKWLISIFAIVGVYDTFVAQFLPRKTAESWPTVYTVLEMTSGYVPLWGWLIGAVALLALISIEYAFRRHSAGPNVKHDHVPDGPVYWEAVEALSWIAVGKAIKAEKWKSDTLEQELIKWPEDLQERFDRSEHQFFERVRAEDLEVQGVLKSGHPHEPIPATHFLSPVGINILHNTLEADGKRIEDLLVHNVPKYRNLQVKRAEVLKYWPSGGSEFHWPKAHSSAKFSGKPKRDIWALDAIYFIAFGSWISDPAFDPTDHELEIFEAIRDLEQAALDGEIPIWGEVRPARKYVKIDAAKWELIEIREKSVFSGKAKQVYARRKFGHVTPAQYHALKTSKAKVEEWRAENT